MRERHPIDVAIDSRRKELRLRWRDLYDQSVSHETMRKLRSGLRDEAARATETERKVEDALGWKRGSLQAIREGGEPVLVDSDSYEREIWANPIFTDAEKRTMVTDYRKLKAERSKGL